MPAEADRTEPAAFAAEAPRAATALSNAVVAARLGVAAVPGELAKMESLIRPRPYFVPSNHAGVNLSRPYLYLIVVNSPATEYRYVGKGSSPSRMEAYLRNVERVLEGKTKRPALTRDGRPQSEGNQKYRYVHLVLATAVLRGWPITQIALENCEKAEHSALEKRRTVEHRCNMNNGPSWFITDFASLAARVL